MSDDYCALLEATGHTQTSAAPIIGRVYTRRELLTDKESDHAAITLGLHPVEVWGNQWHHQESTA